MKFISKTYQKQIKMNFQLPLISYRQQKAEIKKAEAVKFSIENFFRRIALILFIVSGLLLVISLYLSYVDRPEFKKSLPKVQHRKLCNFRKCNDIQNVLRLIKNPLYNKTP